jgi:GntR family transcriptional regulator
VFTRPDPSSGVPVYLQLVEQVRHAIATGALRPGEQLPGIRRTAEDLVVNPNTVAKAYAQLEQEGFIDVRHGAGGFVSDRAPSLGRTELLHDAADIVRDAIVVLRELGASDAEIRALVATELSVSRPPARKRSPR